MGENGTEGTFVLDSVTFEFPLGRDVIEAVLPHRDPFVWVSRILECEPGVRAVGELDIDPELPLFAGHFPSHPVFPGVLLMEALAQVGSFAVLCMPENAGRLGFFGGMDKVKFRQQVAPGDTVTLTVDILRANSRMCTTHCVASVGGKVAAEADQMYVMGAAR